MEGIFSNNQPCQYFMETTCFLAHQRYRRLTTSYLFSLMEKSILKIFGSMDIKITSDFCSYVAQRWYEIGPFFERHKKNHAQNGGSNTTPRILTLPSSLAAKWYFWFCSIGKNSDEPIKLTRIRQPKIWMLALLETRLLDIKRLN